MNLKLFALMLCVMPGIAYSAPATGGRASRASARGAGVTATMKTSGAVSSSHTTATSGAARGDDSTDTAGVPGASCRDAYRDCMNEFCLQDESEGGRCICSDNYTAAKKLLNQIRDIQAEADNLLNVETQKARLGKAKSQLVMDDDTKGTKKNSIFDSDDDDDDDVALDADDTIGSDLYEIASRSCAAKLAACGDRADMEEQLYSRMIVSDCKSFNSYLGEQKTYAEQNKSAAKLAVVNARLESLNTNNKYNRGECFLAYKACVADKGGCGVHFENCLDKGLLNRRANACDNILAQCDAVADQVKKDWTDEVDTILTEGKTYSENNKRLTCMAQTQLCLEENCSPQTNAACLTNPDVAAGICPIIDECDDLVSGFKQAVVVDQLKDLQVTFCENDVEACLKEKCGENFTGPECLGKKADEVVALCPQSRFRTCSDVASDTFASITNSIRFSFNYKQLDACQDHFDARLGAVCGTDMSCLPDSELVLALDTVLDGDAYKAYRKDVIEESEKAVDKFFTQFQNDVGVAACASSEVPAGKLSLGALVFNTAKTVAYIGAQNRALRQLETKRAEISRKLGVKEAEQNCKDTYVATGPSNEEGDEKKSYSYISSVSFEPSLRNCHVCRVQQVCETGGEKKETSALKAASGGLTAGAAMGAQVHSVWGTIIGGAIGAVGAGVLGAKSGGQETYCQQVESCEDINM